MVSKVTVVEDEVLQHTVVLQHTCQVTSTNHIQLDRGREGRGGREGRVGREEGGREGREGILSFIIIVELLMQRTYSRELTSTKLLTQINADTKHHLCIIMRFGFNAYLIRLSFFFL